MKVPLGTKNFEIMTNHVHDIFQVEESEIVEAFYLLISRLKILIEPSCATSLAAIIKNKEVFKGKSVCIILTGGNVDLDDTKKSFGHLID